MKANLVRTIFGGIIATAVMTMMTYIAPYMGLPKMDIPGMLSGMLHAPSPVGWLIHIMIGTVFALCYGWFFINWVRKINGRVLRGLIFGFAVFVFARIMMMGMMAMGLMPRPDGSQAMNMLGSLIGHLVYGLVIGLMITEQKQSISMR